MSKKDKKPEETVEQVPTEPQQIGRASCRERV